MRNKIVAAVRKLLSSAASLQVHLKSIPTDDKLKAIDAVGALWRGVRYPRRLKLLRELPATSGYRAETVAFELNDLPAYLHGQSLSEVLDNPACFPVGKRMLDDYVELSPGEYITANPAGPHLVIGCGNTLLPPLLSLVYALLTNNVVVVRASKANCLGLAEVLASFSDAAKTTRSKKLENALEGMKAAANVFYLPHDDPNYRELVQSAPFRGIHFWGGGQALSKVRQWAGINPTHPRMLVNGPSTGIAVVEAGILAEPHLAERTASELAFNLVAFEQKLCSSPTECYFVGNFQKALDFANLVAQKTQLVHGDFPHAMSPHVKLKTQLVRNLLTARGATVLAPECGAADWTIVVSKCRSLVDQVTGDDLPLSIYERTMFLEVITVADLSQVVRQIEQLPTRACHRGIERAGTVGYALPLVEARLLATQLACAGTYRIVPLPQVFGRGAREPADGRYIPREFTYFSYLAMPEAEKAVFWSRVRGRWGSV